jgi:hypothetical protein
VSGFIYFIAAETLGAVKIGYSGQHPEKRLRGLQTGCPARLKLLAFVPGSEADEARLHEIFQPLHIHGEWFRHELKLRTLIAYLDCSPGQLATREDFEASVSDVLEAAHDFDPLQSSGSTPEYAASAIAAPVGHHA